jgi:hypothetical protein
MKGGISVFMVGALNAFSFDCIYLGTNTLMTWSGVFLNPFVYELISALSAALSAWIFDPITS